MPQTLVIRADASQSFGQGHTLRNRNLAEAFRALDPDARILWAATEETFALVPVLRDTFNTLTLPDAPQRAQVDALAAALGAQGAEKPVFVIDGYHLDRETTDAARMHGIAGTTLFIDEKVNRPLGSTDYVVDFLPNDPDSYAALVPASARLLIGPSYQMVSSRFTALAEARDQFLIHRPLPAIKTVLLMNGGFNIGHMLEDMIDTLAADVAQWRDCRFKVFMMSGADSYAAVQERTERARARGVKIVLHADEADIPAHMVSADLYIGAAGLTPYELGAAGGVPSVVMAAGHNQDRIADLVARMDAGFNAGHFLKASGRTLQRHSGWNRTSMRMTMTLARGLLNDGAKHARFSAGSHQFCDGRGAARVARIALGAAPC